MVGFQFHPKQYAKQLYMKGAFSTPEEAQITDLLGLTGKYTTNDRHLVCVSVFPQGHLQKS